MAVTPEFIADVAEALDDLGYSVENEQDVIDNVLQLNDDVTLPGIRQSGGAMTGYVSMKLAVLVSYLAGRYQTEVKDVWDILEPQLEKAISDTAGAENLDAQLVGMTVTITNRQGVSNSVNIGFEIYRTYTSVAAMNADADNVPEGKFVMIGTTDPTSAENAQLYARAGVTAEFPFIFLSDLDQASSAAWADWLNNMKPEIERLIGQAESDHTRAERDHTTADTDHTQAGQDHTASVSATNAANTEANRAKGYNDHPWEIGNDGYIYVWDETTQAMVKTNKMIIDFNDLTEAQKQAMIDEFYQTLVFATVSESEAAADELT